MIDYIIPEKYRGKEVKVPTHPWKENVCKDRLILRVPENACYLCIQPVEPLGKNGEPLRDSDDNLDMNPWLIYLNNEKRNIGTQDDLLEFDMFSLDRRLELIFKKYKNKE